MAESRLDRFAELISEPQGGRYLTVHEAAARMGLPSHAGNTLLQRLRARLGPQAV